MEIITTSVQPYYPIIRLLFLRLVYLNHPTTYLEFSLYRSVASRMHHFKQDAFGCKVGNVIFAEHREKTLIFRINDNVIVNLNIKIRVNRISEVFFG